MYFPASKQSISVLTDDIKYMDNESHILSEESGRNDTMMFKENIIEANQECVLSERIQVKYYLFYKEVDKSEKIDKI